MNKEDAVREIEKSNGVRYTVRKTRARFFFPDEWQDFRENLRERHRPLFDFMLHTGCRIEEALNVKPRHFDWDRNTVILYVTKTKAKKKEKEGRPRTLPVTSKLMRLMKKHIKTNNIDSGDNMFQISKVGAWKALRAGLLRSKVEDYYNFGTHNVRKTCGNWLKALEVPAEEICLRLGHDYNTFLQHYGSPNIFDRKDKQEMIKILGYGK